MKKRMKSVFLIIFLSVRNVNYAVNRSNTLNIFIYFLHLKITIVIHKSKDL